MLSWQIWLIIAGACLIIEIMTVGFLVFWFALAALVVSFLSLFIDSLIAQTTIFVVLSAMLIFLTRPLSKKLVKSNTVVTNSNRLIGKTGLVKKEISPNSNGQVTVDGEVWTATLNPNFTSPIPEGSTILVSSISGVKLVVEPIKIVSKT